MGKGAEVSVYNFWNLVQGLLEAQVVQIPLKHLQNALEAPRTNPVMVLEVLVVLVLLVPFTAKDFFPAPAPEVFEPAPDFFWCPTRF